VHPEGVSEHADRSPPDKWESWNPVTGCSKVSEGCRNCYAERFAERWRGIPGHHYEHGFDLQLRPERLELPLHWRRPRRVFVVSMGDLFHPRIPDDYVRKAFAIMERTPQHVFHILTKRHERMLALAPSLPWPANVWMGVTVEHMQYAMRADAPGDGPLSRTGCAACATVASPPASPSPSKGGAAAANTMVAAGSTGANGRSRRREYAREARSRVRLRCLCSESLSGAPLRPAGA
jgi:protein gp37